MVASFYEIKEEIINFFRCCRGRKTTRAICIAKSDFSPRQECKLRKQQLYIWLSMTYFMPLQQNVYECVYTLESK